MQVEVSKYTEGIVDKAVRPNGLPQSLIRYDGKCWVQLDAVSCSHIDFTFNIRIIHVTARQKEEALDSITEVVQTVKHPRSRNRSISNDVKNEEVERFNLDSFPPKSIDTENWAPLVHKLLWWITQVICRVPVPFKKQKRNLENQHVSPYRGEFLHLSTQCMWDWFSLFHSIS